MSFTKRSTRSLIASEAFIGGAVVARTLRQSRACKQAGPVWATGGVDHVSEDPDPEGHPRAPRLHVFGNVERALGSAPPSGLARRAGTSVRSNAAAALLPAPRSRHGGEGSGEGLPGIPKITSPGPAQRVSGNAVLNVEVLAPGSLAGDVHPGLARWRRSRAAWAMAAP